MHVVKGQISKADMMRARAAKRRAYGETLMLDGLDAELARARRLLPRLTELNRLDLQMWIDRVTGNGSGVMSADIAEANEILEKFRYSLRIYERSAGDGAESQAEAEPPAGAD